MPTLTVYDARSLSQSVIQLGSAEQNLLRNLVFTRVNTHKTNIIEFGKLSQRAKVSIFRRAGEPAAAVQLSEADLRNVRAPKIRIKEPITEDKARKLNPAVPSYMPGGAATDPNVNFAETLVQKQAQMRLIADTTIEVMCCLGLVTGTITLTYEDSSTATITFGYTGDGATPGGQYTIQLSLSGAALWTASTSNPLSDLEGLGDQIRYYGSYDGQLNVIMGSEAWAAFQGNDKLYKQLDTRRLDIGGLSPVQAANYKGQLGQFSIWKCVKGYDSGGSRTEAFSAKKIVVVPANSDVFSLEYGAVFDRETPGGPLGFIETTYFSKLVEHEDPPTSDLIVETNPLPLVKNPDAVRVLQVVA